MRKCLKVKRVILLYFVFYLTLQSRTWHVPSQVPTIKKAVEDSASYGDTVLVSPGLYDTSSGEYFPINMKNGVTLISEEGPYETVIDANHTNRIFNCSNLDSMTCIEGFTITGGKASNGGGIYCYNSYLKIRNNIIKNNSATGATGCGGGIYCNLGAPQIINNKIIENQALNYCGGGIYCKSSSAIIKNNQIIRNKARWGGGIFNESSSTNIINNIVKENQAIESGGGIDCYVNSSPIVTRNVIIDNLAGTHGAGIACCYNSSPLILYNTIARNTGLYGGGIRSLGNSSPTINKNIIVDNVDGIYLTSDSYSIIANDNNIYFNTYQKGDYEVINNTSFIIDITNNFWFFTDSSYIDSLIYGSGNFIPFRVLPNESAPGEPIQVINVVVMSDSTYTTPLTQPLHIGDTLYIQIEGTDWNNLFIEPSIVILTSKKDTYGIGVALIETNYSSGIYRGIAYIDTISNDCRNRIGVNLSDTIIVKSNIDPLKSDTVIIEPQNINEKKKKSEEKIYLFQNFPNPFSYSTNIQYRIYFPAFVSLEIYDVSGKLINVLVNSKKDPGYYTVEWRGIDDKGRKVKSGIYFCFLKAGDFTSFKKMILIR